MKDDIREQILLNFGSKTRSNKIKSPLRKNIIATCSLVLVIIMGNGILSILNLGKKNESEPENNFLFTMP